jgi:hypothetical protein
MERKFLFMRCICIWLGKVARAWICLQTIIKCGDNECNEWGYLSKPLHVYWAFKEPSRRKLCTVTTKTGFKCHTIKVNLTLDGGQYSASCFRHCTSSKGPLASSEWSAELVLICWSREKNLSALLGNEPWFLGCLVCSFATVLIMFSSSRTCGLI